MFLKIKLKPGDLSNRRDAPHIRENIPHSLNTLKYFTLQTRLLLKTERKYSRLWNLQSPGRYGAVQWRCIPILYPNLLSTVTIFPARRVASMLSRQSLVFPSCWVNTNSDFMNAAAPVVATSAGQNVGVPLVHKLQAYDPVTPSK